MFSPRALSRLILGILIPWAALSLAAAQTPDDAIVARVNGEALLLSQLKEAALDQDIPPSSLILSGLDSPAYRKALTQIVDEQLLVQQAGNEGLRANDMDTARDVEQMLAELRGQLGSQEKMDDFLSQHHLTLAGLRTLMTQRENRRTLAAQVVAKRVVVDDVAVARFTAERKEKKQALEELNLSQILVRCTAADRNGPGGEALKRDAMRAAREAGTLTLNDMPAFLRRYNALTPPHIRASALGWLDPETLRPELRDAARKLQPGEVSQPLETGDGYHILVLLGRHSTRDMAFAAEFEKVRDRLLTQLRRTAEVQLYDLAGHQVKLDLTATSASQSLAK